MTPKATVRGDVNLWMRTLVMPTPLIKRDRPRPIDRIIDYFGGADRRTASVASFHTLPVPWREEEQTTSPSPARSAQAQISAACRRADPSGLEFRQVFVAGDVGTLGRLEPR